MTESRIEYEVSPVTKGSGFGSIEVSVKVKPIYKIKARVPRKQKKEIIRAAGRDFYKYMIEQMNGLYSRFGYHKFNL